MIRDLAIGWIALSLAIVVPSHAWESPVDPSSSGIELLDPDGGERLLRGSTLLVNFLVLEDLGPGTIAAEISTDGGTNYVPLVSVPWNGGTGCSSVRAMLDVPASWQSKVRLRYVGERGERVDVSEDAFVIEEPHILAVVGGLVGGHMRFVHAAGPRGVSSALTLLRLPFSRAVVPVFSKAGRAASASSSLEACCCGPGCTCPAMLSSTSCMVGLPAHLDDRGRGRTAGIPVPAWYQLIGMTLEATAWVQDLEGKPLRSSQPVLVTLR